MFDWLLGPTYADRSNPIRLKLVTCFLACGAAEMAEQGLILGATNGDANNPKLEAVLAAKKVRQSTKSCLKAASLCSLCGASCRLLCRNECVCEVCTNQEIGEPMEARSNVVDIWMEETKKFSVGKEATYWYVYMMAVDPDAQGKGHCSRLMRAICQQADIDGLPVHLECSGEKNREIYQRFGFYPVKADYLETKDGKEKSNVQGYGMYRPAKGRNIEDCHQVIDCSIEAQVIERDDAEFGKELSISTNASEIL